MAHDIDEVKDDMRRYRKFCSICHHHSALVAKKCEHCNLDCGFKRFFPKKKR